MNSLEKLKVEIVESTDTDFINTCTSIICMKWHKVKDINPDSSIFKDRYFWENKEKSDGCYVDEYRPANTYYHSDVQAYRLMKKFKVELNYQTYVCFYPIMMKGKRQHQGFIEFVDGEENLVITKGAILSEIDRLEHIGEVHHILNALIEEGIKWQ